MKNFIRIASLVVLLGVLCSLSVAQTALTQTTLTAAMGAGPATLAGGAQANLSFTASLTSATGVQTAAFGSQPITWLYVDQELMGVIALAPGSTLNYNVLRAQSGTKAGYHRSGAMVLIGTMSPQFGGFAGSGGFQTADPPLNQVCTAANTGYTPWVNILSGEQWLCSTVTNTWVPGWNNRFVPIQQQPTAAVANAGTFTPSGPYFHLTGAGAFVTITPPLGFERGCVTIIMDAADTWTAAGNIIVASAAAQAAGETVTMCWDATTSKWYPSHV